MMATPVGKAGGAATSQAESVSSSAVSAPASDASRGPARGTVGVLIVVAVAVRLIVWHRTTAMMNDGPAFLGLAQHAAAGRFGELLAHPYHPLYPLAVALVQPLFPSWESAAVAVSVVAGALAVVALHAFLRATFGPGPAAVGALLLAVHPYAVPFSADVQSEGLYMATFLGAVALAWRALEDPRWGMALGAGVLSGLAYLTRPEGIGVVLVGGAVMLGLLLRGERSFRQAAVVGAGMLLGAALFVAPYTAAVAAETGELRLTRKKSVVEIVTLERGRRTAAPARADAARPTDPARSAGPVGTPADPARSAGPGGTPADPARAAGPSGTPVDPARAAGPGGAPVRPETRLLPQPGPVLAALRDVAGEAKRAFRLDHFIIGSLGAVAAGGPLGLRGVFLASLVLLYGFVLVGLHVTVGYVSMRHVLPPLLPLLGYVALGVPVLGRVALFLPRRLARRGPPSARASLLAGLALLVTASTVMAVRPQRVERAAVRAAAEWLAAQPLAVERVASAKERDAYYARAGHAELPAPGGEGGSDWIEILRRDAVRYAIVDEKPSKRYPGLGAAGRDPRIRVLHRTEAEGRVAFVVEVLGVD